MADPPPSPPDEFLCQATALFPEDYPVFPTFAILQYMAEGAANVLYRIEVPLPESSSGEVSASQAAANIDNNLEFWKGKLLRLRKDLPYLKGCNDAWWETKSAIWTYFEKKHVVDQNLIVLVHSGVVKRLNEQLKNWETMPHPDNGSLRPEKRKGSYIADDYHGLLIEDMTPGPGVTLLEFKPKWLVQSPAAPPFSKRCRTCAKRARDNYKLDTEWKEGHPFFCPLDLMARDDVTAIHRAARAIFLNNKPAGEGLIPGDELKIGRIAAWAQESSLLWNIRNLQKVLGSKSIFEADHESEHFRAAMTLRDCTMYIHIPDDESLPITAKIGDLELKSAEKAEYWKEVERCLIFEGWYEGEELTEPIYKQPLDCSLFPEEWTPYSEREGLQARW